MVNREQKLLNVGLCASMIPNAGHALLPEQPRAVAAALLEFVSKLSTRK